MIPPCATASPQCQGRVTISSHHEKMTIPAHPKTTRWYTRPSTVTADNMPSQVMCHLTKRMANISPAAGIWWRLQDAAPHTTLNKTKGELLGVVPTKLHSSLKYVAHQPSNTSRQADRWFLGYCYGCVPSMFLFFAFPCHLSTSGRR